MDGIEAQAHTEAVFASDTPAWLDELFQRLDRIVALLEQIDAHGDANARQIINAIS